MLVEDDVDMVGWMVDNTRPHVHSNRVVVALLYCRLEVLVCV